MTIKLIVGLITIPVFGLLIYIGNLDYLWAFGLALLVFIVILKLDKGRREGTDE
jgi:hypothetical protein